MINKEWQGTYPDLSSVGTSFYNTDNYRDKSTMTMRMQDRRKEEIMLIEMAKQKMDKFQIQFAWRHERKVDRKLFKTILCSKRIYILL